MPLCAAPLPPSRSPSSHWLSPSRPAAATTTSRPPRPGGDATSSLTVHATDALKFGEDAYSAEAGEVTFEYVNDGSIPHTLLIEGIDGFKLDTEDNTEGSVDLEPGDYTLYCDIPGHSGMKADLTVE